MILMVLALFPVLATAGELSESADGPQLRLSLPDLTAQRRGLEEFAGKVLLVNFWASWCTPCITEMPSIQRLAKQMADKPFAVIAVNVGESQRRARVTAARLGLEFPVLLDQDSAVFNGWGAIVLPTTYILDQDGVVRYVGRGPLDWDGGEAIAAIEGLLSEADAASKDRGETAEPPG